MGISGDDNRAEGFAVPQTPIDDLDRKIIDMLQTNGRESNTQIAASLGVTESTVRKRIDRLLSENVMKITAVVNPLEMEYPIVAIFGLRVVPQRIRQISDELHNLTEFRFIGITVGAWDFVTEGWFSSVQEMHSFLNDKLWPIEGINNVEISHIVKMIRYAYDWGINVEGSTKDVSKIGKAIK